MPRDLTKAEEFWAEERTRRSPDPDAPGLMKIKPSTFIIAQSRLNAGIEPCRVDGPLSEAIRKGFLIGTLSDHRADVSLAAWEAYAETAATYAEQVSRPIRKARREVAARLANDLRALLQEIEEEAAQGDRAADKFEVEIDTAPLWALSDQGKAVARLLDVYGARSEPNMPEGPRTDHESRTFFAALFRWWQSNAVDGDRRGGKALRNRIAAALWIDLGRTIPASYAGEKWADVRFGEFDQPTF